MGWGVDQWASVADIVSAIWIVATTLLVAWQIGLQRTGVDTEKRRFLRESIEVIHKILQDEEFRTKRRAYFQGAWNNPAGLDQPQINNARAILSTYGVIARMVRHGAIDEKLVKEYWLSTFRRDWDRLKPFVDRERQSWNNAKLFEETENLANRWAVTS